LGVSLNDEILFDLEDLITPVDELEGLVLPFITEEIDSVILSMPNDKAPSPNGFNSLFFKKSWHIIGEDIYSLCRDFFNHCADLKSISSSLITLIPKKNNPEIINDFRPISLLNTSVKILTKLLANRLQKVILRIIHENQFANLSGYKAFKFWINKV